MSATVKPGHSSLEAAADWYATLRGETATEQDQHAWQIWMAQSADHALAWAHIEAVGRRFDPLRSGGNSTAATIAGFKAARRRSVNRREVLGGLAGLGLAGWLGWRYSPVPEMLMAWCADYRTGTGEQRDIQLSDGTQVWLNTDSALNVAFDAEARLLVLLAGEILIETGKQGGARPFYVDTHFGRLQALGTRFSVRHDDGRVRLDVYDGMVEIRHARGEVQRIAAGQGADFGWGGIGVLRAADRAHEAWSRGVVVADDIPLGELLAEISRYRNGHIAVAPEISKLSVMGVYPAKDSDQALAMLESTLPIRVRRILPWWVSVDAR